MPGTRRRRRSVLLVGAMALMAVGCATQGDIDKVNQRIDGIGGGGGVGSVDQPARDDIKKINDYLGTVGDNGETEKSLLVTLNKNNDYLRKVIKKMQCDIYDLQHNTHNCPGQGGGSTSPTNVPKYPA